MNSNMTSISEERKTNSIKPHSSESLATENNSNHLNITDYPLETGRFKRLFNPEKKLLGSGAFGKVYKAIHKLDKGVYAIKRVAIRESSQQDVNYRLEKMLREVAAMVKLHHQSIVRYVSCWLELDNENDDLIESSQSEPISNVSEIQDIKGLNPRKDCQKSDVYYDSGSNSGFCFDRNGQESYACSTSEQKRLENIKIGDDKKSDAQEIKLSMYIQLEYCEGQNLREYLLGQKEQFSAGKAAEMFHRILDGVNTFHKEGILHRDLKPENIFLDEKGNIKIGDFGLASNYLEKFKSSQSIASINDVFLTQGVGTPQYMSPEMLNGSDKYDQKTDIYSLGIIFYEMLYRFGSTHERILHLSQLRDKNVIPQNFVQSFPEESALILKMVSSDPIKRPLASELMSVISKRINYYDSQKFKEGQGKVIGYDRKKSDLQAPVPVNISSLMVENENGMIIHVVQGLKDSVKINPPGLGKIIIYKYITVDSHGCPENVIFKG